jgi:hypothetical protein
MPTYHIWHADFCGLPQCCAPEQTVHTLVVRKIEQRLESGDGKLIGKVGEHPMKIRFAMFAVLLAATSILMTNARAQTPQKSATLTIAGHPGEAQLLQVNGKSYVEVEALARLTQGTLSFKANQTILTLPAAERETPAPRAAAGFSRAFTQAGIEEMSAIREWRRAIVNAVQTNTPLSEDWIAAQHSLAEKNLALAASAASTDDDRSASPMLSAEFNNMQSLSDLYLTLRKQAAAISPDTFHSGPLEDQILSCAQGFVSMTESRALQDQPACH